MKLFKLEGMCDERTNEQTDDPIPSGDEMAVTTTSPSEKKDNAEN